MLDELRSRIRDADLLSKVTDAEEAVKKFVAGSRAIAKELIPKLVKPGS